MQKDEAVMDQLYNRWCIAEFEADCIYDELGEDFTHPQFIKAESRSRDLLFSYLSQRTKSLRHILLKLQVACDVEDYLTDSLNPTCRNIAPRAVVEAIGDLQNLVS